MASEFESEAEELFEQFEDWVQECQRVKGKIHPVFEVWQIRGLFLIAINLEKILVALKNR